MLPFPNGKQLTKP